MRKILITVASMLLFALSSCDFLPKENGFSEYFTLTATVVSVTDSRIEVNAVKTENISGPYSVIITATTDFYDNAGNEISQSDVIAGDYVEILYSGQVMLSYPPQIVAYSVKVL